MSVCGGGWKGRDEEGKEHCVIIEGKMRGGNHKQKREFSHQTITISLFYVLWIINI
jgi:hypothetical protein